MSSFKKSQPKIVTCRSCRSFHEKLVLSDLGRKLIQGYLYKNCQDKYNKITSLSKEVLDRHAFIKQKKVGANQAPLITKELSRPIINKSKAKKKYMK